jgi:type IV pilus assembly protein PilF
MKINAYKLLILSCMSISLVGCSMFSNSDDIAKQNQLEREGVVQQKPANYKVSAETYAELALDYTQNDYLDLAKTRLVRAQKISKEHGYDLAIVNYAAGFYYQAIGSDIRAEEFYENALDIDGNNFEALNLYAQFLCQSKYEYSQATDLFDKSLSLPSNNNMAQTLYLYSNCMTIKGDDRKALELMKKSNRFQSNFMPAKYRLARMYMKNKEYKNAYRIIYGSKDEKEFFNNKGVLEMRLKLAEYAHNRNETATIRLILSSNNFNEKNMNEFFSAADNTGV